MSAIVYFEIHFDDAERAKKFYAELFGWKVEKAPGTEYWMITTQEGTNGGMMKRFNTNQRITDYFWRPFCPRVCCQSRNVGWQDSRPQDGHCQNGIFCVMYGHRGQCFWPLGG